MLKFIVFVTFVAVITAHNIPTSYQHVVLYQLAHENESPRTALWNEEPKHKWSTEKAADYDFKYEVHDEQTGDIKRHSEESRNNAVKGQYSLIDSDGFRRLVEYTADDIHGFQATVKREPTSIKIPQQISKQVEPKANLNLWAEENKQNWEHKEPETPANYDFKYEVHDEKTGDIKRQSETASNGAVKGQYSLIDSDGLRRVVEYTADDIHGFQATVKREPTSYKIPQPAAKPEEPKMISHWW